MLVAALVKRLYWSQRDCIFSCLSSRGRFCFTVNLHESIAQRLAHDSTHMPCNSSIFLHTQAEDKIWPIQTGHRCHPSGFPKIIQKAWLIRNMAFSRQSGLIQPCSRTLTLQTIAALCLTGIEAQIFLKLFTTSNILRTKKENKNWIMVRLYKESRHENAACRLALLLQSF